MTQQTRTGMFAALLSYLWWGLSPIYWKLLQGIPPFALLAHRVLWSALVLVFLIAGYRRWPEVKQILQSKRSLLTFFVTALLIGGNWLIFIVAVNEGHVLEASLGYYICPLMSVLLGIVVLKERINVLQLIAIGLAAAGVVNAGIGFGSFPWLTLSLAATFSLYALLRKTAQIEALPGLAFESFALIIPAALYLMFFDSGEASYTLNLQTVLLLFGAGLISTLPLLLYTFGARRITLFSLGILQYVAPTCMFLLGVFVYDETFTQRDIMTFVFIWSGLFLVLADSVRQSMRVPSYSRCQQSC